MIPLNAMETCNTDKFDVALSRNVALFHNATCFLSHYEIILHIS